MIVVLIGVLITAIDGTTTLHGALAKAFTDGLHVAFYSMVAIMAVAALLSAVRGRIGAAPTPVAEPESAPAARKG
jgi:hypothetical protein